MGAGGQPSDAVAVFLPARSFWNAWTMRRSATGRSWLTRSIFDAGGPGDDAPATAKRTHGESPCEGKSTHGESPRDSGTVCPGEVKR